MVREENVKLMTKIAIYEKKKGKEEIPINSFYKGDYIRLHSLKAVVSATITFALAFALLVIYKLDFILANVLKLDYKKMGVLILIIYVCWILFYWIIARILYSYRYESMRSNIMMYNHKLKKIEDEMKKKIVKTKGGININDDFIDF